MKFESKLSNDSLMVQNQPRTADLCQGYKNEQEMKSPFETLSSEEKREGRFTVIRDRVRVNETEQDYDYLKIREGVCVLAVYKKQVILQRQYRYPVRSWERELPGGFVDDGETPERAAKRELAEETGFIAERVEDLGFFYPSFGSTDEKIHLFYCECRDREEAEREPGEVIRQKLVSVETMRQLVLDGEFRHGAGLAAWARAGEKWFR